MNKKQRKHKLQRAQHHSKVAKEQVQRAKKVDKIYQNEYSRALLGVNRSQPIEPVIQQHQDQLDRLKAKEVHPSIFKFAWLHSFLLKLVGWWRTS